MYVYVDIYQRDVRNLFEQQRGEFNRSLVVSLPFRLPCLAARENDVFLLHLRRSARGTADMAPAKIYVDAGLRRHALPHLAPACCTYAVGQHVVLVEVVVSFRCVVRRSAVVRRVHHSAIAGCVSICDFVRAAASVFVLLCQPTCD